MQNRTGDTPQPPSLWILDREILIFFSFFLSFFFSPIAIFPPSIHSPRKHYHTHLSLSLVYYTKKFFFPLSPLVTLFLFNFPFDLFPWYLPYHQFSCFVCFSFGYERSEQNTLIESWFCVCKMQVKHWRKENIKLLKKKQNKTNEFLTNISWLLANTHL